MYSIGTWIFLLNVIFVTIVVGGDLPSPPPGATYQSSRIYPGFPWVDVRSHGATANNPGDDDAVMINAGLDYAVKTGMRTVYIPEGTWDVSTTIKIPSNITLLMSDGARIRLKAQSRLEYGIITNRNAYMGNANTDTGVRIIGGTIDGNSEVPSSGDNRGIFLCKSSQSVVENVTVKDTIREGIRIHSIDEKGHSDHSIVRFCKVIRRQATVENILISTHLDDPKNRNGKVAATRYTRVEGCYSFGGSHGIAFSNVRFAVAVNNVCKGNTHRGIILSPTCEDCLVTGNVVVNAGSTGIHLAYNSKRCVISNNIVSGTVADGSKFGIEGQGIKAYAGFLDLIISGNQVSSNATDGIALEGGGESKNFIISNNISSSNKRDGIRLFAGNITLAKHYDISNGAIFGNSCNENRESGIRLGTDHPSAKTVSISITGNTLSRNGKWGIHEDASKGLSLGTNNYDSNKLGEKSVKDLKNSPDV